eukprot:TRINITY_DN780106_c0_g1_i1.p1 TRINITY_DN780106_c0_g1~~TRINITY_DN780106_c0_g1_i1.p1  ORF type:complete len:204 (-),score=61.64 TRINITY_DN780106_c0_g1_i1:210-749(-)
MEQIIHWEKDLEAGSSTAIFHSCDEKIVEWAAEQVGMENIVMAGSPCAFGRAGISPKYAIFSWSRPPFLGPMKKIGGALQMGGKFLMRCVDEAVPVEAVRAILEGCGYADIAVHNDAPGSVYVSGTKAEELDSSCGGCGGGCSKKPAAPVETEEPVENVAVKSDSGKVQISMDDEIDFS